MKLDIIYETEDSIVTKISDRLNFVQSVYRVKEKDPNWRFQIQNEHDIEIKGSQIRMLFVDGENLLTAPQLAVLEPKKKV